MAITSYTKLLLLADVSGTAILFKGGFRLDARVFGVGLEPWLSVYLKDGFSVGTALYLNFLGASLCMEAYIQRLHIKFCWGGVPCGFSWRDFVTHNVACMSSGNHRLKIFEVGGGSDTTPPLIGEVVIRQITNTKVHVEFVGFLDEETGVQRIDVLVTDRRGSCVPRRGGRQYLYVSIKGAPENWEGHLDRIPQKDVYGWEKGSPVYACVRAFNADGYSSHAWSEELVWDATPPVLFDFKMYDPLLDAFRRPQMCGQWKGNATKLHECTRRGYIGSATKLKFQMKVYDVPTRSLSPMTGGTWMLRSGDPLGPTADGDKDWLPVGSGKELDQTYSAINATWLNVSTRELALSHNTLYTIHLWISDSKGNRRMYISNTLLCDLTPPPNHLLRWPRVFPDRYWNTTVDNARFFFIHKDRVQPSWNTQYPSQLSSEPLRDPESGDLEAFWTLIQVVDSRQVVVIPRIGANGGYSSYGDAPVPGGLMLGGQYLVRLDLTNPAGLTSTTYSETIIADWTRPVVETPFLSSLTEDSRDGVVQRWEYPPGASTWGGIRGFAWVGEFAGGIRVLSPQSTCGLRGVGDDDPQALGPCICNDPESGIHSLHLVIGSRPAADDVMVAQDITGLDDVPLRLDFGGAATPTPGSNGMLREVPHGEITYATIRCRNGANVHTDSAPPGQFRVDRTPPVCLGDYAVLGEGDLPAAQHVTSRLMVRGFTGVFWDAETGIRSVEYTLRDLTNGTDASLPLLGHVGLPTQLQVVNGLTLLHNHTYLIYGVPTSSTGLTGPACATSATLIDVTPPQQGSVSVVRSTLEALEPSPSAAAYQSSARAIYIVAAGFADEESGLDAYHVGVIRSDGWILAPETRVALSNFVAFPTELQHGQSFYVTWRAVNRAGDSTNMTSAVVTVDVTPPVIEYVTNFGLGDDQRGGA